MLNILQQQKKESNKERKIANNIFISLTKLIYLTFKLNNTRLGFERERKTKETAKNK